MAVVKDSDPVSPAATAFDRRRLLLSSARLAAWAAVFDLGQSSSAWAKGFDLDARGWAKELEAICRAVLAGTLAPAAWQDAVERLHARVPLEEIVRLVDLDAMLPRMPAPERRLGAVKDVAWPGGAAVPFGHKLFVYRKGACTPPHAHNHLVSAHLVLRGRIRARTFHRVEDLERSILVQPTGDRTLGPGHTVSMSDDRDNVHWFEGVSDLSVSFDVPVGGVAPEKAYRHPAEAYSQIYLDPTVAPRGDGRIDAPIIKFRESVEKFG
jgi:hypothetical protein